MPTYAEYLESQGQLAQQVDPFERLQACCTQFMQDCQVKGLVDSVDIELRQAIVQAATDTDTQPTEAQKKAGSYRKGKVQLHGLTIAIENPKGSTRSGTDQDGKPWSVTMKAHYGYILRTESEADGDHIDVFLGEEPENDIVYVIDQVNPETGVFDEHKCCLGFRSAAEARQVYQDCYAYGWQGFAGITTLTMSEFKEWLKTGDTSLPATGVKTLSAYDETRGGALVPPPRFGAKLPLRRKQPSVVNRQKLKELRSKYRRKDILSSVEKAGSYVAYQWERLESRYGRRAALTMALAMIASSPLPGNIAAIVAAAEAIRGVQTYFRKDLVEFYGKAWVTIGGGPCKEGEGQHCGGTRVEIDGSGQVRKGPTRLRGSRLGQRSRPRKPQAKPSTLPERKPTEQPKSPDRPEATKRELKKSKATVTHNPRLRRDLQEFSENLFGITDFKDYASLVGAPDDAQVNINLSKDEDRYTVQVTIRHSSFTAVRSLGADDDGNLFIKNVVFFMKAGQTGKGLGTEVFSNQVAWAKDMGFSYIKTDAARSPSMNGYYTWMRQGYDAPVAILAPELRASAQRDYPQAQSVLDIMSTPEGREWWKENGDSVDGAIFDLTEGSRSWQTHKDYLQERVGRKANA